MLDGDRWHGVSASLELKKISYLYLSCVITGFYRCRHWRLLFNRCTLLTHTQSLYLTDIARSLGEDIALHATHKRLSRNLARKDLIGFISNALLQRAARDVTQDMMLVVNQKEHFLLTFLKCCEYI